jgi:nudix-type nucleoside diphosphatase (YffH/AdpP family)
MADEILSKRALFNGWFNLLMLSVRNGGETFDRAVVEHPSGSAVLCYDAARRVAMLVSELRVPVAYLGHARLREAVAGVAEDGDFAACAIREAMEETGIALRSVEPIGRVWMTPSTSTERVHLFLAEYRLEDRVGSGGGLPEEGEKLSLHETSLAELWADASAGKMTDAKTFMLLQALRLKRPELF